jgi:hypothetical protein
MSAQVIEERVQSTQERGQSTPAVAHHHRRPGVWQRVRHTVAEMNYASRRVYQVQAQPGLGVNK